MIPKKVQEHINEYIYQEVYVQIAVIKGREKITTDSAINKYFTSNHFKDLSEGKPYNHFIDGLKDKCLEKLKNSPMRNQQSKDEIIIQIQKKLNELSDNEILNTFWEIETGEFLTSEQIKELESQLKDVKAEKDSEDKRSREDQIQSQLKSLRGALTEASSTLLQVIKAGG